MANEVTVFVPQFEDALYQAFDPIRVFAKQDSVAPGAKTVSIPVSGGLTFADITASGHTYPRNASDRSDSATTYDLTKIEVNPFRIGRWDEFVTNANLRESIFNEVAGLLGSYATRVILNGFHSLASETAYSVPTSGSTTYVNSYGDTVKALSIDDVAGLAKKLDMQSVPRDGNRYLILDPEMHTGFLLGLAAMGYEDTATQAFRTGTLPQIHGFNIVMMHKTGIASLNNAALIAPNGSTTSTSCNFGFALHKNFVGFAASSVNLFLQPDAPEYYGSVVSGDFYAGGSYRRANPIGCLTVYEKAS
jgi:hypothetical protein